MPTENSPCRNFARKAVWSYHRNTANGKTVLVRHQFRCDNAGRWHEDGVAVNEYDSKEEAAHYYKRDREWVLSLGWFVDET